jgi:DNA helicase MCM8
VRLWNVATAVTSVGALRAASIGRLVSVTGSVVRVGGARPRVAALDYDCAGCGQSTTLRFPDGRVMVPKGCVATPGCKGRPTPRLESAALIDWQRLRLQDAPAAASDAGSTAPTPAAPPYVDVDACADLVDAAAPGDAVTVVGVVRVAPVGEAGGKAAAGVHVLTVEAVSVCGAARGGRARAPRAPRPPSPGGPPPADGDPPHDCPPEAATFSRRDARFVARLLAETGGAPFPHLVHALAPAIHGHALVKAALVLALFGGVGGARAAGRAPGCPPRRSDIHVLLCGDPGLGKSQLLQAVAAIAPRGVYVCGSGGASAAGLTASVGRDPATGAATLDAGALALADRGAAVVDELDKLSADHAALLGVMEEQQVVVAKAGVAARLPARAALLAAANPAGGAYDARRTLADNVRMPPALVSRFDLVFVLADVADAATDAALAARVLALAAGGPARAAAARVALTAAAANAAAWGGEAGGGGSPTQRDRASRRPLADALRAADAGADPVPPSLFRTYVAYARAHCHPTLSAEAADALRAAYAALRADGDAGGAPATPRSLESLVRLAEARARADLRDVVTADDAADAADLAAAAARAGGGAAWGPCGDAGSRSRGGVRAEADRLLAAATSRSAHRLDGASWRAGELLALADELDLDVPDVPALLDALNEAGELLKKGGGVFTVARAAERASRTAAASGGAGGDENAAPAWGSGGGGW